MNIFIFALGTRGDVQPYIALGLGLQKAGHQVTICTVSNFQSFVEEYGLNWCYTYDDVIESLQSDIGRAMLDDEKSLRETIALYAKMAKLTGPLQTRCLEEHWQSVEKAAEKAKPDLILYHPKAYGAPHYAEKLGIPVMLAALLPGMIPTGAFPSMGFPMWKLGGWYNKLTTKLFVKLMSLGFAKYIKAWRQLHDLPAMRRSFNILSTAAGLPIPAMHGMSQHVLPPVKDWPSHAAMMGYWFLDRVDTWQPPAPLVDFLNAGDPPVYIGFGSMAGRKAAHITRVVIEALQKAKVRGILATGWGGLEATDLPDSIYKIDAAPHDWLFPRMAGVVHHGGAGTTAAGLRFGRPTLIVPFFGDQPYCGQRMHELGIGPAPIQPKKLAVDNLAIAFRELVDNSSFRANAAAMQEKLRQDDSIKNALDFIERHMRPRLTP
jgi:sterol 3beta-glucosyltransferase